jgi:hypothetical protein
MKETLAEAESELAASRAGVSAAVDAAAQAETVFREGLQLCGEQRFSEAAERWGRAALRQHGPSHAHVSDMLIHGKPGVAKDVRLWCC